MSEVSPRQDKVNDFEVDDNRPTSESLLHKISGDINYMLNQTDIQSSRLDNIEGKDFAFSQSNSNVLLISAGTIIQSVSLVPSTSNVAIFCSGYLESYTLIYLQVKRNGVVIFDFDGKRQNESIKTVPGTGGGFIPPTNVRYYGPDFSMSMLNCIDTGATAGVSNTYEIVLGRTGSNPFSSVFKPGIIAVVL